MEIEMSLNPQNFGKVAMIQEIGRPSEADLQRIIAAEEKKLDETIRRLNEADNSQKFHDLTIDLIEVPKNQQRCIW